MRREKVAKENKRCGACSFYERIVNHHGHCLRYPPAVVPRASCYIFKSEKEDDVVAPLFPIVQRAQKACGEFAE